MVKWVTFRFGSLLIELEILTDGEHHNIIIGFEENLKKGQKDRPKIIDGQRRKWMVGKTVKQNWMT